jgi:hypothetical protein
MTRFLCFAIALTGLLSLSAAAVDTVDWPPLVGTAPSVEEWIWVTVVTPTSPPSPILYLSPKHFKTRSREALLLLSESRFSAVAKLTRSHVTGVGCPIAVPKPAPDYTVQIAERDQGRTAACAISQTSACQYLSELKNLAAINWTSGELQPIDNFANSIRCKRD